MADRGQDFSDFGFSTADNYTGEGSAPDIPKQIPKKPNSVPGRRPRNYELKRVVRTTFRSQCGCGRCKKRKTCDWYRADFIDAQINAVYYGDERETSNTDCKKALVLPRLVETARKLHEEVEDADEGKRMTSIEKMVRIRHLTVDGIPGLTKEDVDAIRPTPVFEPYRLFISTPELISDHTGLPLERCREIHRAVEDYLAEEVAHCNYADDQDLAEDRGRYFSEHRV